MKTKNGGTKYKTTIKKNMTFSEALLYKGYVL